ncbi:MAG: GTPase HflX [Gemmatimonadaceae bacterium]|nr:GTPase HflX [Gemmatimonadaceae bacterium]NUQ93625.1 GTPase HflX [Gemmatimonadaceae bacterium]NUR19763.1 GTPase HflX [Gemmatimonadaceae bacterium]NUS97679.1 GTPase HflX [Gemmatimonadaceae bacterium]
MLVGAPRKRTGAKHHLDEHLRELAALADTAGAEVVGELTQQIDRPNSATYLGKGKIEELRQRVSDTEASLVIFDDELTPSQGKNIEDMLATRVVDRAELILDIFATRARTAEAKMQVELAQLEYTLPRLTRMWTHLEKFRGGIGVRGPGETQLETDRRLINHRIKLLKERLQDVQKQREIQRQSRRTEFKASLVGYTNAGKSSILRSLSGAQDVFVENRLFATLDPLTREADLGEHGKVLLTDTVGFVRKLPHQLVASFRATLEEARDADLLLHVIDASHPTWEEQRVVVDQVLAELGLQEKPVLHVFNKIDQIDDATLAAMRERMRNLLPNSVFVSTLVEGELEPLKRALVAALRARSNVAEVRLGAGDGKLLAEIHRGAEVLEQRMEGEEIVVRARMDEAMMGRVRRAGGRVEQV